MYPLRTKVDAGFTRWSSGYLTASSKTCWTHSISRKPGTPAILDADWMIVARGISPEKFVGQKAAGEEFRNAPSDQTHETREGVRTMSRTVIQAGTAGRHASRLVRLICSI